MNPISLILEIILVKIDIEMLVFYLKRMTKKKANLPFQLIGNAAYFVVAILGSHFFNNILVEYVLFIFFVMGNLLLYKERKKGDIVYAVAYIAADFLCEEIASIIFYMGFGFERVLGSVPDSLANISAKMFLLVFIYFMVTLRRCNMDELPRSVVFVLFIIICCNIVISLSFAYYYKYINLTEELTGLELGIVGLLAISVLTYWLFEKLCRVYQQLLEEQKLKSEYERREIRYQDIEREQEEIRKIRHNIKNQLLELNLQLDGELNKENREEAMALIEEIDESLQNAAENSYSQCFAIDALLRVKLEQAKNLGIEVTHQVLMSGKLNMKRGDMGVILGNLLDNAIEAAQITEEPFLSVRIIQKRENLMMEVKNSCLNMPGKEFATSKSDAKNHGFGIKSMQQVAKKYEGTVDFSQEQQTFIARIMLFDVIKI